MVDERPPAVCVEPPSSTLLLRACFLLGRGRSTSRQQQHHARRTCWLCCALPFSALIPLSFTHPPYPSVPPLPCSPPLWPRQADSSFLPLAARPGAKEGGLPAGGGGSGCMWEVQGVERLRFHSYGSSDDGKSFEYLTSPPLLCKCTCLSLSPQRAASVERAQSRCALLRAARARSLLVRRTPPLRIQRASCRAHT